MSTSRSPMSQLRAESSKCADAIKKIERMDPTVPDPQGRIARARMKNDFTFGIVMDDKVVKITLDWEVIRQHSDESLAALILRHMLGSRTN